ncbi:hypothetical protein T484DRAFT_1784286, partial [Baffinella frigidus]
MTPNLLLVALVTVLLVQGVGALECWSSKVSGEIIDANGFHNADQTVTWGMWAEFIKPNPMGYQQVTCPASVSQCIVIASMPDLSTSYDTSSSAVLMAGCLDPEAPWVQALDIKCGEEGTVKYAINALNAAAPTYAYKCCSQVDATGTCNPLWNQTEVDFATNQAALDGFKSSLAPMTCEHACVDKYAAAYGCLQTALILPAADVCAKYVRPQGCLSLDTCYRTCNEDAGYIADQCPNSYDQMRCSSETGVRMIGDGTCDPSCMTLDFMDGGDCVDTDPFGIPQSARIIM